MTLLALALLIGVAQDASQQQQAQQQQAQQQQAPQQAPRQLPIVMPPMAPEVTGTAEQLMLSPIYGSPFVCSEHWMDQLPYSGDALGTDCMVTGGIEEQGFMALYRTDGATNADWYGWEAPVLAPISGEVVGLLVKDDVNTPGTMGRPPAAMLQIRSDDGIMVVLAHVAHPLVAKGDRVAAGQVIAQVGNNGMARAPHIHVGAWRDSDAMPLQIRWDQRAMAALYAEPGE